MDYMHCQCCRCTQMQDKLWLPMTDEGVSGMGSLIASGLESSSFPRHLTDGHWFGRASRPEVIDTDLNHSFDPGNSRSLLDPPSISSMGNLVCSTSAVSALQPSKLLETEFSWNDDTLSQFGLHSYTSQAPGRDGQVNDISQGLTSINQEPIQSCVATEIFDPLDIQLKDVTLDRSLFEDGELSNSNTSMLPHQANQPPICHSDLLGEINLMNASSVAQIPSSVDPEAVVSHADHQASLQALGALQPMTEFPSLSAPTSTNGSILSSGRFISPALLPTNPSNWYDAVQLSMDAPLTPTPGQREPSLSSTLLIPSSSGHPKYRKKTVSLYCCPHLDCNYTAKIWRDVERHLASRKHGEFSLSFPCSIEGCNFPKDNPRKDNLIRHMETVHGLSMRRMNRGRREKHRNVQTRIWT